MSYESFIEGRKDEALRRAGLERSFSSDTLLKLMQAAGLSQQQMSSKTIGVVLDALMSDGEKILVEEANARVQKADEQLDDLIKKYNAMAGKIDEISTVVTAVSEAQKEYGECADEKARDTIALFGGLLQMCEKMGAAKGGYRSDKGIDPNDIIRSVSYVVYAYLGGGARQVIAPFDLCERKEKTNEKTDTVGTDKKH